MPVATAKPPAGAPAIRPLTFETPEADLEELRARIAAEVRAAFRSLR